MLVPHIRQANKQNSSPRTSICRAITAARLNGALEGLLELCLFSFGNADGSASGDGAPLGEDPFGAATIEASVGGVAGVVGGGKGTTTGGEGFGFGGAVTIETQLQQ